MAIPFSLKPFESISDIVISGRVVRAQSSLTVEYTLTGAVEELVVPSAADEAPSRRDQLWQDTCFEVFIGLQDSPDYWEVNVAPNGDWNVYHFNDYRQAMTPELACTDIASTWQAITKGYHLTLELPTDSWLALDQSLAIGISTILKIDSETGSISHWALAHPGEKPDFHRRDSFSLLVEG
ncbi:MAG: DOMON-like domain-containing protein [Cyanobacteria bacterium P01_D01_bin.56]